MKLYQAKLPARVWCSCADGSAFIDVKHMDGAYSFCVTEKGNITHLAHWAELEPREDGDFLLMRSATEILVPVAALEVHP